MTFVTRIVRRAVLLATALFLACPLLTCPKAVFAMEASAMDDWATIVAKAKQEGIVVVHGAPGQSYNVALVDAFNKAYPDIKVQFSGASGSVEAAKALREREAGIYNWDVWVSGPTGALGTLKKIGFFQPLRPILRPDITADDKWTGGFDMGWMDTGKDLFYAFDGTVQNPVMVNWDVVKKSDLTSLADLEGPKFAGKIVWRDPRRGGSGNGTSQTLLHNLGEDGLIKLYKNHVVYTPNGHQLAEWVVRGRYPIGIGLEPNYLNEFQSQGLGKNVKPLPDSYYKIQQISVGFGAVGFVSKAPHPDAAIVYINWLLSKAGQEAWSKVPRNSRRADVPPTLAGLEPKPTVKYFMGQEESRNAERKHLMKVARDVINAAPGR